MIEDVTSSKKSTRWYSTVEAKGVAGFLVASLIILGGGIAAVWGLDTIANVSKPLLQDQIPQVRIIEETLATIGVAQLATEQALDQETQGQLGEFNAQRERFENARQRIEVLLAALTWGSETEAFKQSEGGLYARGWEALGYRNVITIESPDKLTAQHAGAVSIYFQGFMNNAQRALDQRLLYIESSSSKESEVARSESKLSMAKARGFAELASGHLSKIVSFTNQQAQSSSLMLRATQGWTRSLVITMTVVAIVATLLTGLLFTRIIAQNVATIDSQLVRLREINTQNEQSGKLLIRRDLELSRANERLRALDQLKSDFISVATHQMRTPLSGIRWTLSMLMKGDLGELANEQRTFLMKAYESVERLTALLNDMLFSDKIDSGKLEIGTASAYVPDLVDSLLLDVEPSAAKRGIHVNFVRPVGKLLPTRIDPQHLRAVLQNIVENAIKYSKLGGSIGIEIHEIDNKTQIKVSDSGIGIPEEQKSRLFTRFFRAPNAIKLETDGSGLGLYIVKNIIEKYNGKIWFESVENVGTTFFIELPASKSENKV